MDIKNINSGSFLDPSQSTERANKPDKVAADITQRSTVSSENNSADKISLSNSDIKTEKAFALNVLDKLTSTDASKLNEIKAKIASGAYGSDDVTSEVSALVSKDLSSIESNSPARISEEKKDFLLNDPEVLDTVSKRIGDDLNSI